MIIPGADILSIALQVIASQQFDYYAFAARAKQPNGLWLPAYSPPVSLMGSVQPVPRDIKIQQGLELQTNYITVYVSQAVLDVSRDASGDQIIYNGNVYQVLSRTAWDAVDGWDAILCVQTQNIAVVTGLVSPVIQNYVTSETLTFSVTFNAPVTVTGIPFIGLSPNLAVAYGTLSGNAAYVSGSGTDTLVFAYTVVSGDAITAGGIVVNPIINGVLTANGLPAYGALIVPNLTEITLNS